MRKLKGIIPVLITPLDQYGNIDESCLTNLCEKYLNSGVEGLWVLGTGGEDMCLSFNDRLKVANIVSEKIDNKLDIILGCSFFSPKESFEFIKKTSGLKISAYHAMPYHQKVSLKQIFSWYEELANFSPLPFWCYTSGNWAQRMSPEFIKSLKIHNNIVGVKYSSSNIIDIQGAIELEDENFQVITAVVKSLFTCLSLGVKAATSVEANLFLNPIKEIFESFNSGNIKDAYSKQKFLNNVLLRYPSSAAKDNFLRVAEIKYLMKLKGHCGDRLTNFYRHLNNSEKNELNIFFNNYIDYIF